MEKNELWKKREKKLLETMGEASGVIKNVLYSVPFGNNDEAKQELMRVDRELWEMIREIRDW